MKTETQILTPTVWVAETPQCFPFVEHRTPNGVFLFPYKQMEYKQIPSQIGAEVRTISANDWSILERKTAVIEDLITFAGAHGLSNELLGITERYFCALHELTQAHPDDEQSTRLDTKNVANTVFYVHLASQILEGTGNLLRFIQHLKDEQR